MSTEPVDAGLSCRVLGQGLAPGATYVAGSHAWTHFFTCFWTHPYPWVSSRADRKILALPFQESMALHETHRPWRMSEHAVFACVSKCSASCRLCNWEEMLPLLLLSPTYLQAGWRQFFPIPSCSAAEHPIKDIKCKDTISNSGHLERKLLGAGESSGKVLHGPSFMFSPRHPLSFL